MCDPMSLIFIPWSRISHLICERAPFVLLRSETRIRYADSQRRLFYARDTHWNAGEPTRQNVERKTNGASSKNSAPNKNSTTRDLARNTHHRSTRTVF